MMHDRDSAIVAVKPKNNAGQPGGGASGAKGGDRGKRGSAEHAPYADPGSRDLGAGPRTASRSAFRRQTPKVEAGCLNRARPDLWGVLSNEHSYREPGHGADLSRQVHWSCALTFFVYGME
jgi:hypothetical protein